MVTVLALQGEWQFTPQRHEGTRKAWCLGVPVVDLTDSLQGQPATDGRKPGTLRNVWPGLGGGWDRWYTGAADRMSDGWRRVASEGRQPTNDGLRRLADKRRMVVRREWDLVFGPTSNLQHPSIAEATTVSYLAA